MIAELACAVLSYRDEPFLIEAVRSVLDQSVPCEVVVVNSGGGDPASRLAAAGFDVPVYNFAERLYPGAVRNIGADHTRAPYLAYLAADCIAMPGWAASRLREHRAGAAAVASLMTSAYIDSSVAWASLLLQHNRRLAETKPNLRLLYGLSYDRSLFKRFGRFREDLRAGEDTEFNMRFHQQVPTVSTADTVTAHRYPTRFREMLLDAFRRGRLQAQMRRSIEGESRIFRVVAGGSRNITGALVVSCRSSGPQRGRFLRAWPIAVAACAAHMSGALTSSANPVNE